MSAERRPSETPGVAGLSRPSEDAGESLGEPKVSPRTYGAETPGAAGLSRPREGAGERLGEPSSPTHLHTPVGESPFRYAVAVDCVVFGYDGALRVLLVRRGIAPFLGEWALPGGFVRAGERPIEAAARELTEETGLPSPALELVGVFGDPDRDPRGPVLSIAWCALVPPDGLHAGTDAAEARWLPARALPRLAFDHEAILAAALAHLRARAHAAPIGFDLLPERFTLPQIQALYEEILGAELDKRNFRKKLQASGLLVPGAEHAPAQSGRPARTWSFDRSRYAALAATGFSFRL
jgi:8-oxo-dGTP diphosphatase